MAGSGLLWRLAVLRGPDRPKRRHKPLRPRTVLSFSKHQHPGRRAACEEDSAIRQPAFHNSGKEKNPVKTNGCDLSFWMPDMDGQSETETGVPVYLSGYRPGKL